MLSAAIYGFVAWGFPAAGGRRDLALFLGLFAALFVLYWLAFRLIRPGGEDRPAPPLKGILLFAALFRLILLFAGLPEERPLAALARDLGGERTGYTTFLLYDNDLWRYLWDGHVRASGFDPYEAAPARFAERAEIEEGAAPLDSPLWWDVLDNVSFQGHTTVYPPAAQLLFGLSHALAPGSVFVLKALLAGFDLAACALLAGLLRRRGRFSGEVLLYAWNPLAIKEIAGSGHADALMIFWLVLALWLLERGRGASANAALGIAVVSKLGAAILVPLFLLRTRARAWWALPAGMIVPALAFVGGLREMAGGLAIYGRDWVFNSGPWAAARSIFEALGAPDPALAAHGLTKAALIAILIAVLWRERARGPSSTSEFALLGSLVLLHPAVMPWYLLWALPAAILAGYRSWILLTALSLLSYLIYADQIQYAWWLWVEHGIFLAALGWEIARRPGGDRPAPHASLPATIWKSGPRREEK
jgi:hypothetical protein